MRYDIELDTNDELIEYYNKAKKLRKIKIHGPAEVVSKNLDLQTQSIEFMRCHLMDNQNRIIATMSRTGTVDHCTVYPRDIIREALNHDAVGVILVHNHPGGSSQWSPADIRLTREIGEACRTMRIDLLDHILLYGSGHKSGRSSVDFQNLKWGN